MKKTWIIPVTFEMEGEYKVEAETLEEAIEIAESGDYPCDSLPEGDYIDDSFRINMEIIKEVNDL